MSKKFKKIIGIVLSLMVVCSAFGLYASANNSYKSPYSFSLTPYADYAHTAPRPKDDKSLVYVKLNTSSNAGAKFKAYGTHYSSNTSYETDMSLNDLRLYPGDYGYIYQNIYDAGYYYAVLGVKNAGTITCGVSGEWSPDSDKYY